MPPRLACAAGAALRRTAAAHPLPPWTRRLLLRGVVPAAGRAVPQASSARPPLAWRDGALEGECVLPTSHRRWPQTAAMTLHIVAREPGSSGRFFSTGSRGWGGGGGGRKHERQDAGSGGWHWSQWWGRKYAGGSGSTAGAQGGWQGGWGGSNSLATAFAGCLAVCGSAAVLDRVICWPEGVCLWAYQGGGGSESEGSCKGE